MSYVYHSRARGEGCGHEKIDLSSPNPFKVSTDHFKAMLFLGFIIFITEYLCMHVLVIFFFFFFFFFFFLIAVRRFFFSKENALFGFCL